MLLDSFRLNCNITEYGLQLIHRIMAFTVYFIKYVRLEALVLYLLLTVLEVCCASECIRRFLDLFRELV